VDVRLTPCAAPSWIIELISRTSELSTARSTLLVVGAALLGVVLLLQRGQQLAGV
jgi:hypothetical protein